ncbi:hypothetical protein E6W17_40030 [Streptomyces sp. A1547]|nr:hypothetical protein E6W17_40030 [Streptomyces sp. A1547]
MAFRRSAAAQRSAGGESRRAGLSHPRAQGGDFQRASSARLTALGVQPDKAPSPAPAASRGAKGPSKAQQAGRTSALDEPPHQDPRSAPQQTDHPYGDQQLPPSHKGPHRGHDLDSRGQHPKRPDDSRGPVHPGVLTKEAQQHQRRTKEHDRPSVGAQRGFDGHGPPIPRPRPGVRHCPNSLVLRMIKSRHPKGRQASSTGCPKAARQRGCSGPAVSAGARSGEST